MGQLPPTQKIGHSRSAVLFNALKVPLLATIPRPELSDHDGANLATRLINVLVWHEQGLAPEYELDSAEVRDLLAVSPARIREHVAWLLWRLQGDEATGDEKPDGKSARWREIVGPIFNQIWPLDARLRTEGASQNLFHMAMETEDAFPEAVDTVADFLMPYELYSLEYSFRLEAADAALIERYPTAIIKLANALIDPRLHPVPRDLGRLLDDCQQRDPQIVHDPAFLRLNGFRRLGAA